MAKLWELIDGKCYCNGNLMSQSGCHGANCRTCCYNLSPGMISNNGELTRIDEAPLFSTAEEAEAWGAEYGLTGHHQHSEGKQKGYMAGQTHELLMFVLNKGITTSEADKELTNRLSSIIKASNDYVMSDDLQTPPPLPITTQVEIQTETQTETQTTSEGSSESGERY